MYTHTHVFVYRDMIRIARTSHITLSSGIIIIISIVTITTTITINMTINMNIITARFPSRTSQII